MKLAGELDSATSSELVERFEALLVEGPGEILLDLEEVTFIDSAGLRAIVMIERAAGERVISLAIRPPAGPVADLLEVTGIGQHVALAPLLDHPPPGGPFIERVELEFAREPTAPGRARAELRDALGARLGETDLATVTLLTSELVTNAVIHPTQDTGGTTALRITAYPDRVRVEVTDPGPGFDVANLPARPRDYGGRGLLVVEGLASRWGTTRGGSEPGFTVWFELDMAAPAAATGTDAAAAAGAGDLPAAASTETSAAAES
jgi:serine/threonine-protein kinase RsbW